MKENRVRGSALMILITVYWGLTSVLMKHALSYMDSVTYIFFRFLSASAALALMCPKTIFRPNRRVLKRGCVMGVMLALSMELLVWGLRYTSNANSVFISQICIVIVPLIVCIRTKTPPRLYLVLSVLLMLAGVYILAGSVGGFNIGDFISLGAALFNSLLILVTDRYVREEKAFDLGVFQVLFACLFSFVIWAVQGCRPVALNWHSALIIAATGVVGTGVAFVAYVIAQKMTNSVLVSLLSINTAVFGVVGGALIPDLHSATERITAGKVIGCAIIVLGISAYLLPQQITKSKVAEESRQQEVVPCDEIARAIPVAESPLQTERLGSESRM